MISHGFYFNKSCLGLTRALHFEAAYSMIPHPLKARARGSLGEGQ